MKRRFEEISEGLILNQRKKKENSILKKIFKSKKIELNPFIVKF